MFCIGVRRQRVCSAACPFLRYPTAVTVSQVPIAIVIPTYGRHEVLVDTLRDIMQQQPGPSEIIVVDQTPTHPDAVQRQLRQWHDDRAICWRRHSPPSITGAMNLGLQISQQPLTLFLDDDVVLHPGMLAVHAAALEDQLDVWASVGQVIQPEQDPEDLEIPPHRGHFRDDLSFPFNTTRSCDEIFNVMAGNLCVRTDRAIQAGGFDNMFYGVAFRFESEFARRLTQHGGRIVYSPDAGIDHLRAHRGGTRSTGSHLTSIDPRHGFGDYYFALRSLGGDERWRRGIWRHILRRPFREIATKFHLRHPWWIPVKFIGEIRALVQALFRSRGPAKLIAANRTESAG
ncbi:MAG: glycosyltransferase [Planctomycetota bacterium]